MLTLKGLREFWRDHADAEGPLRHWHKLTTAARWSNLAQTRATFPHADEVRTASGTVLTVFNIAGNKYRLLAHVRYSQQRVYVERVLTHAEYSRGRWRK